MCTAVCQLDVGTFSREGVLFRNTVLVLVLCSCFGCCICTIMSRYLFPEGFPFSKTVLVVFWGDFSLVLSQALTEYSALLKALPGLSLQYRSGKAVRWPV